MSDPVTLGLVSTAVGLVNNTISLFKQVNESAKNSDNLELKSGLNDLYSEILSLKALVLELSQENADLRKSLDLRGSVKRDTKSGNFFVDNDPDPLCPICWERDGKTVHLRPARQKQSGTIYRKCLVCNHELMAVDN
jgi:hypothetical protein